MQVLLSFVGNHDPSGGPGEGAGPVLSLLASRHFDRAILYCTGQDYFERARSVEVAAREQGIRSDFRYVDLELDSPIDYEEIYPKLRDLTRRVCAPLEGLKPEYWILLDPGTPQMQTSWFLLAQSGALDARLLQGIPARFGGGKYRCREVELDSSVLPLISERGIPFDAIEASASSPHRPRPVTEVEDRHWVEAELPPFVADCPAVRKVFDEAARVARYADTSILIRGETGTGKEVLARFIHERSRRTGPFKAVNLAAIPAQLFESELFGHVKGAFTGPEANRLGAFRYASGGTILLDEVGDLPLELQAKLLRAIEEKTFSPLGSDEDVTCDVHILAATNRDLEELIERKAFRQDLYERLNHVTLYNPPLRERREDLPRLASHFLEGWTRRNKEARRLSPEVSRVFMEYAWPGNIRELRNTIEGMCGRAEGELLDVGLLPAKITGNVGTTRESFRSRPQIPPGGMDLRDYMVQLEKAYYEEAVTRAGGNKEQAAKLLGIEGAAFRKAWRERFEKGE